MKKWLFAFSVLLILGYSGLASAASQLSRSAVGYWKTYNHKTKRPSSVIYVWRSRGMYYGKVYKSFANSGEKQIPICTACKGKLRNKPVVGLTILRELVYKNGKYVDGTIVDPRDGKEYRCSVKIGKKGKRLYLRGYIGISLFGRTETWYRTNRPKS